MTQKPFMPLTTAERRAVSVDTFTRSGVAHLRAIKEGGGTRPSEIVARDFGNDTFVRAMTRSASLDTRGTEWITRSSIDQATTASIPDLLQKLVADFIASLSGVAAAPTVIAGSMQLSFGRNASISVSSFTTDASKSGFTKQGENIPVHSRLLTPCILEPAVLKTITTLSNEMVEGSNAETMLRDAMVQDTYLALDTAFFDANPAVALTRPASIRNGIAALPAGADMVADIKKLVAAVAPVAGNEPIILVAAPAKARTMQLSKDMDFSTLIVLPSDAITNNDVIAIAPRAIVSAAGSTPELTSSFETLLHMEDAAPTDIGLPGSPPVVATPVVSTYQSGNLALKCRYPVTWQRRDDRAVAWLTATW